MNDVPGAARLAEIFAALQLSPPTAEHPPVFTVEEARAHKPDLPGAETKNLFLKDAKGALHLVTLGAETRLDMKALAPIIGAKKLSFGSPALLLEALGTTPGSVSPLALVNDSEHQVRFSIERALTEAPALTCHPLRNTATVSLSWAELKRIFAAIGAEPQVIDLG